MKSFVVIALVILFTACSQQQARRPISQSSGTFMQESIDRNKKRVTSEEKQIDSIIKSTPEINYIAAPNGFWYRYERQNTKDTLTPKRGDIAYFDYEIKHLDGTVIYTKEELKSKEYYVDKEDIIIGLRNGIKLMHKGETVTFLFPSHLAFGYHGDDNRVEPNVPLMYTVTLTNFKPDTPN